MFNANSITKLTKDYFCIVMKTTLTSRIEIDRRKLTGLSYSTIQDVSEVKKCIDYIKDSYSQILYVYLKKYNYEFRIVHSVLPKYNVKVPNSSFFNYNAAPHNYEGIANISVEVYYRIFIKIPIDQLNKMKLIDYKKYSFLTKQNVNISDIQNSVTAQTLYNL